MTDAHDSAAADETGFDLIDKPWIPVLGLDGSEQEVSLRRAILAAHEYRDIAGELPTVRFALLRILLSIAYRVLDRRVEVPAEAWGELWDQPELPAAGFEHYFAEWRHRFDLFDAEQPFMQTPDLRTAKDEWKPVSLMVADADPDGSLFTMRSELDMLTPPEAARWLVHAHAYDYSGIKSGAVGDDRVKGGKGYPMGIGWAGWLGGTALRGATLRETILLNLIMGRTVGDRSDLPIWERPVLTPAARSAEAIGSIGPIALMSWPQRRIRLRRDGSLVTGVLVSNGDEFDYTVRLRDEPMTGWRFSEPQSAKAKALRYMPRKLDPGRALWRGLSTLIPLAEGAKPSATAEKKWNVSRTAEPAEVLTWLGELVRDRALREDYLVEVSVVSMEYGTQNASFAEVVSDRLAFAAALADLQREQNLLAVAQDASRRAEGAVVALARLARDVERAAGGDGEGVAERVSSDAYAALDRLFREWLLELRPHRDGMKLLADWTEIVRRAVDERAGRIVEAAPETAWIGRLSNTGGQPVSVATAVNWFESALYRTLGARPRSASGSASAEMNAREDGAAVETETAV